MLGGVGLLFVGAVLLINGLGILGLVKNPKDKAIMNFCTGFLQLIIGLYIAIVLNDPFAGGTILLFAFTYIWVGANSYTQQEEATGFGWYCLFVAVVAMPTAAITFMDGGVVMAAVWVSWGILWFMFFLLDGLQKSSVAKPTAYFTLFNAIITGAVGYMMIAGWYF